MKSREKHKTYERTVPEKLMVHRNIVYMYMYVCI